MCAGEETTYGDQTRQQVKVVSVVFMYCFQKFFSFRIFRQDTEDYAPQIVVLQNIRVLKIGHLKKHAFRESVGCIELLTHKLIDLCYRSSENGKRSSELSGLNTRL